jgi:2-succinyl-6-hydroxy-2,4-cyclohexadiene-1-carboxylate synthase
MARHSPLYADIDGSGRRLVLVHGFTQTRNCWVPIGEELAHDHEVVRVDAPGHGRSGHELSDLWRGAELLGGTGGGAVYLGYSMGGRLCLHLALAQPELVDGLILVGATAGIIDDDERAERARRDDELANQLVELGLDAFLDKWLAQPLFAGLGPLNDCRAARLENDVERLAASLRYAGTGNQDPLWDRLDELAMPVLCLAGQDDKKFRDEAAAMSAAIGDNAIARWVPGAGHTAHLEQPVAFLDILRAWLSELDPD